MNLFRRTNAASGLRVLAKQISSSSSALPHRVQPICLSCNRRQLLIPTVTATPLTYQRHQTTAVTGGLDDLSTWQRMKWNMGLYGKLEVPNKNLKVSGYNLYVCCTDFIDFNEFVKVANLPDTFNSWFLLLQLHMWMVSVKFSQMGREGVLLKQYFYTAMWQNVEDRLLQFEDLLASERRNALKNFYSLMILSIMYYDEGILGCDKTLANSLWTQLYGMDPELAADKLELMVEYVRKQVHHHDNLNSGPIMRPGYISFLPLVGDRLDKAKVQRDFEVITAVQPE